ncbi:MAG: ATP-binding protein, partial [Nocardioidaceae bacterium]
MSSAISIAVARDPRLVRTVRLVAAAVARRVSRDEEFVEEVRLAIGEACGVLVQGDGTEPIRVLLNLDGGLSAEVIAEGAAPGVSVDGVEPWALLRA